MPEPPGQNNFRSPYPSGQLAPRPDQPLHGQQPIGGNHPYPGTGTNNNRITGALQPNMQSPYKTRPLLDRQYKTKPLLDRQQYGARNNANASGMNFPPQPSGTPSRPNWGLPPEVAARAKKRRLIQRARNRYQRLSGPGKIMSIILVFALLIPSLFGLFEAVNGIILYSQVRGAIGHLQAAQAVFSGAPREITHIISRWTNSNRRKKRSRQHTTILPV
ncbi:hypothetical protein [Dictyobacter vulcani]|uniref:hypothetical protein n=1 Tax=Dictyobacter vulcani TaxID=2607529 RepID=UPI001250CDFF|nr:hypothetical protein [Dictyobacter vulcani]